VCILNWNSGGHLTLCVGSVQRALAGGRYTLVVVDNRSTDESLHLLKEAFPDVGILQTNENLGYARGNNVGARFLLSQSCAPLLFLNPDVVITREAIEELVGALRRQPAAGCAGGTNRSDPNRSFRKRPSPLEKLIVYGVIRHQPGPLGRIFTRYYRKFAARHFLRPEDLASGDRVYAVSGACMIFQAPAFAAIGGFDESTFLYEEEFIVSEKLLTAGLETVAAPGAVYDHVGAQSTRRIAARAKLHFIRSEQYLLERYYRWPFLGRMALLVYRVSEWVPYAFLLWATRSLRRLRGC
jgi:GT2 family glycosyltransferase